jgi:FkbM family methyltransferase
MNNAVSAGGGLGILRAIPLAFFAPFRLGAVRFVRGTLPRKICVGVAKLGAKAWAGRLSRHLSQVVPLDRPDLTFAATDSMVIDAVYWYGVQGYEGMVADIWITHCRGANSILEVGGNVGLFTVIGGQATAGRYTVVEPLPANAAVLRDNLQRNGLKQVEVLQAAAIPAANPATVRIAIPDEHRDAPVGAHLSLDSEVSGRSIANELEVPGLPFRSLAEGRDLIKIDAEGIEAVLIESGWDVIARFRPTLMIEVLPESRQLAALIARLATEVGYEINVLPEWGSDRAVPIAAAAFEATTPQRFNSKDVLLTPALDDRADRGVSG